MEARISILVRGAAYKRYKVSVKTDERNWLSAPMGFYDVNILRNNIVRLLSTLGYDIKSE